MNMSTGRAVVRLFMTLRAWTASQLQINDVVMSQQSPKHSCDVSKTAHPPHEVRDAPALIVGCGDKPYPEWGAGRRLRWAES